MNDNNPLASAAEQLTRLRSRRPLIHHITNFVVMNLTANITLCAGALPVMAHARQEVEDMASSADALVLNLGTLWPEQVEAMLLAGGRANAKGIPVVLDPVGAGATRYRTESAHRLLRELSISIVRGNAAEMAALTGIQAGIRGVESVGSTTDITAIAATFARRHQCVAAVTGPVDVITDGLRLFRVSNGHPLMAKVTGTGCMATSVIAAFSAVEKDSALAAAAALACYGLAGEKAAERCQGPGSFQMHLFDAMAALDEDAVRSGARIRQEAI
ncbi:MAG TPA: hydroxyethylthiazole kinase [Acidobacteriaceae bacterium]